MLKLDYDELYELSNSQPEKFWDEVAQEVVWDKPYTSVLENKDSIPMKWFVGGEINMSYNCLDRAVEEGYANDVAVIHESPVTNTTEKITYKQLLKSVELLAGVMVDKCGMRKGDIVLLYFPMIPQCLIAMLACTRIGAIYSATFGGFSSKAISSRIKHLQPKLILTSNVGFEQYDVINYKAIIDLAIEMSEFIPDYCIVYNRPNSERAKMIEKRDLEWNVEMRLARPQLHIPVESNHPMFIIYTSGTTGEPKGLMMSTGNSVVSNKYVMKYHFGLKPRECFWMFSDFGWITGQTLLSYCVLLSRSTTIIYEGKPVTTPDAGQIVRIMNRNKVVAFVSAPTIMRMLRNNCNEMDFQFYHKDLRTIFVAGEVCNEELKQWISESFKCSVYDVWAQTEITTSAISPGFGFKRDHYDDCVLLPNMIPVIVDNVTGEILPNETPGRLLLKKPWVPSMAISFYKDHERFLRTYFQRYPGYYDTMDYAVLTKDRKLRILSRADDIIQVCAARVSGGALEEICLHNENVIEAAVVPLDDQINGQVPIAFIVKKQGRNVSDEEVINKTIELVNSTIGEFILFRNVVIVPDLPRTRTGKISRFTLGAMVNKKEFKVPVTLENVEIFKVIHEVLVLSGYKSSLPTDL